MRNRRAFLKTAGAAAAGRFLSWNALASAAFQPHGSLEVFRSAALFAGSGALGRVALIRVRAAGSSPGIRALEAGVCAVQPVRDSNPSCSLPLRIRAARCWRSPDVAGPPHPEAVTYDYGDVMLDVELPGRPHAAGAEFTVTWFGAEGTLIATHQGWSVHWNDGRIEAHQPGPSNALPGVGPSADLRTGRLSALLWRLGGTSCELGREVRLDTRTAVFSSDERRH